MKRFYFTLIILTLTFTYSYCQSNWKKGYVIQINNDTIRGFIDDRGSKGNTRSCYFRESINSETTKYTPEDIHGFRFEKGKFYISRRIDDENFKEPLFLEFLIKGEVNIYHIKMDVDRYYIEKDTLFYELKNTTEIVTQKHKKEGRTVGKDYETQYEKERNEYKGMLNYLMQDANMSQKIYQSNFSSKSLIKVSKKYHEAVCHDEECIIFEKPEERLKINFRAHAGLSMNYFNFGDLLKTEYSQGALIGCRLIFNNPVTWMEPIDLHVDFTFQKTAKYRLFVDDGYQVVTYNDIQYRIGSADDNTLVPYLDVDINALALKIPVSINYRFLKEKFRPYCGFGLANVFIIRQNEDFIYYKYHKVYDRTIPHYQVGITGKVGCSYEIKNTNIYFDLIYENTTGLGMNELLFKNEIFSFDLGFAF